MKTKNPLYVVKGKDVQEASSVFDLVMKKLNLEPVIQVIQNILKMLLEQVKNYQTFVMVKAMFDEWINKYMGLVKKFGMA